MKISKFIAVALSAIVFVQAPVVAFADEYTDTADLYKLGEGDYLFAGRAGFYLTDDTNVKNGDNPYPGTGEGTQVTENIAGENGIDYGAGHAFDCQWDPGTYKEATGLADPFINGSHQALGENDCVNLKYNGTNYTLTLTAKGSGATPGSENTPTHTPTTTDPDPSSDPDPAPATDENQPQETPTLDPEQQESSPAPEPVYQPVEQPQEPEAPAPVAINVVTTAVGNALPTTELGNATAPTKTVALDLFTISPAQLVSVVSDTVVNAPAGGNVVIETNAEACLDKNMIQAFTQRPDVAINIVFKNKLGQKLRVTIPAGYPVTTLLDANGYCGYMHLVDIFGATILSE